MTTYTRPGDRVLLADIPEPGNDASRPSHRAARDAHEEQRDGLVEAVLRLGRGATAHGDEHQQARRTAASTGRGDTPTAAGPMLDGDPLDRDATIPIRAEMIASLDRNGPKHERFDLIITTDGASSDSAQVGHLTARLAEAGTLVVLTHSDWHGEFAAAPKRLTTRLAGLTLTDRLILLHQPPSKYPPTGVDRVRVMFGAHRRVHSDAWIYRLSTAVEVSNVQTS